MPTPKHKELTVQIVATLKVGYNQSELDKMGKTFRELKHGIEHLVKADLLPTFQADPDCEVNLMTVGFPSARRLANESKKRKSL